MIGFGNEFLAIFFDGQIFFFIFRIPVSNQIDQDRSSFAVKGQGMFKITFVYHISCFYAGQFFHGLVPGEYYTFIIDDEGRIRQKVDNLNQALLVLLQLSCALFNQIFQMIAVLLEFGF